MSILFDYPNHETLMMGLAKIVAKQLSEVLDTKGKATLAVPGGTTPAPFLERLSLQELDWANVTIMMTDERLQPTDAFRSNFKMVEHYLSQNESSKAKLLPMAGVDEAPDAALKNGTARYVPHLPLDVVVLGMGADMHTASLFPDSDEVHAALSPDAPPLMVMTSASQPEDRITMTAPVLMGAANTHVLITGPEKLAAYIEAEEGEGPAIEAPIRCVLQNNRSTMVHHTLGKAI
ncbi:6-phosphogluconolactonase [Amylibacter sp. SFDW26]|uniref:6-phosphogluconolactonase n=1 Tax=Amylibacter sp. SFDW26 TaxID=2652722 RepID=UPI00126250D8|nr:6-phosphogluconolactonase [Amylibacter sp. SFDW26]KAB7615622.1 6-phosphogluconolactonase [Amylibacter sp. SFDW26]